MTPDKQNNGYLAKPFTPTLSSAFHRSNKSPLTPKLASSTGYRTPKRLAPSDHPSKPDSEPSLLSANVTPRSGARSSRRDGLTSTDTVPTSGRNSPQSPFVQASVVHGSNVGGCRTERSPVRAGGRLEPSKATRAKTLTTEPHQLSRSNSASDGSSGSPMFFHASDARSSNSSEVDVRSRPPSKVPPQTTFVYANGVEESRLSDNMKLESTAGKRLSAGLSRLVAGSKPPAGSPPITSPKLNHATHRLSDGLSLPGSLVDSQSEVDPYMHSPPLGAFSPRVYATTPRHFKPSSMDSGLCDNSPKEGLRPSPIIISPSDSKLDASALTSEPISGLRPRIFSSGSTASVDTFASATQSPVKSEGTGAGKDDAATSARTERKILDLEISNSSLLAINRTLEREMRKQNAELRRYRRLSRSGRLSMAPSTRSVSGNSLAIMSELDEGSEYTSTRSLEESSDFSDEESMVDDGVMSPDSLAEHDARHQARDEKRFFVDLAKHQELLADSQKMNQSLKRCLGWTEELINEAKKALEYSVHVNDVQLGGRVLSPEELSETGEIARDLIAGKYYDFRPSSSDSKPATETA
ncbi:hypothetical protein EYZ11_000411 [Aspergillus tanneri]|uniref:Uncharacterized protein n=1 Tax=Aspergillus tanneri TaxID=1220188 RepID=A0A4S3JX76_9EURO|nr:uncharacterized protein ATNIH1004_006808 [Aspergillus tanneri]KAA8645389.1 hypothetical protein ATNIH1004_006808 [Aspergillus tanneri]THD00086.1 hypothetical protein EYZ11_000411 [Aspergillus tanneri]